MRKALLAALAAVLILSGCGGHSAAKPHKTTPPYTTVAKGHPCAPGDYYMQCALRGQQQQHKLKSTPPPSPVVAHGIDWAWACPSPSYDFGVTYFSTDSSKNWTSGCVQRWRGAGKRVVGVWETSATRALSGYNGGFGDAWTARRQARALGWPNDRPLFYAIDFDASGPDVYPYFLGAIAGDKSAGGCGHFCVRDYGGALPTNYLCSKGITGNWATYAWMYRTGYRWPSASCAPLEQWLNDTSVDYDRAIAADYGQVPYKPPAPPPPARPRCFGPHAQLKNPVCKRIRPQVAHWSQARDSTLRALAARRCSSRRLASDRSDKAVRAYLASVSRRAPCGGWRQRAAFFAARVHANLY